MLVYWHGMLSQMKPAAHIRVLGQFPADLFLFQLHSKLRRQKMMTLGLGSLPPLGETQVELLTTDSGLAQSWALQAFSLSLYFQINK